MTLVKNVSDTSHIFQEFIWKPGETLIFNENGLRPWEDRMAEQLVLQYSNLKKVDGTLSITEKRKLALEKARQAKKEKRELSNHTT